MAMHELLIDCVRHGACGGPASLRGRTDVSLNEQGRAQMQQLRTCLPRPDRILSSPLGRCVEGARLLAEHWQKPLAIMAELAEMDFGEWDGLAIEALHQQEPQALARFWQDPYRYPPPNSEALTDFSARCERAWQHMLGLSARHLLVVTHAGVIKHWLAARLGITRLSSELLASLQLDYAGLVRFRVGLSSEATHSPWVRLEYLGPPAGLHALAPACLHEGKH